MTPEQVSDYVLTAVEVTRRASLWRGAAIGGAITLLALTAVAGFGARQRAATPAQPAPQPSRAPAFSAFDGRFH